jgi:hypothetical protein
MNQPNPTLQQPVKPPKHHPRKRRLNLSLRFSPTAWAKLLFFRDKSPDEIGGFGISDPDDLLYIREFVTLRQEVSIVSVRFQDDAIADFFEDQVTLGRKPEQFARHWLHTHPKGISTPSQTDEETFERVFGHCQWAVMAIVSQDNQTYARISFNIGPGGQVLIPVQVDYSKPFEATDSLAWEQEFKRNILTPSGDRMDIQNQSSQTFSVMSDKTLSQIESRIHDEPWNPMDDVDFGMDFWGSESEVFS